jgi:hypothetical protein
MQKRPMRGYGQRSQDTSSTDSDSVKVFAMPPFFVSLQLDGLSLILCRTAGALRWCKEAKAAVCAPSGKNSTCRRISVQRVLLLDLHVCGFA